MPLIWTDTLSTGLRPIDLQHQELIDLINALEVACQSGRHDEVMAKHLPQLSAYVLFHFATEDALLDKTAASHAEMHRRQHQEFADRVAGWRGQVPEQIDLGRVVDYLKLWLVEHIMKTDRELARQVLGKSA